MTSDLQAELLERAEKVLAILPCEECEHSLDLHFDRYGCSYERGDLPGDESGPARALPPCGCKAENLSVDGAAAFTLLCDLRQVRILKEMETCWREIRHFLNGKRTIENSSKE
jgi:hypothetical protein